MEILFILGYVFFAILIGGILNSLIRLVVSYKHTFGKQVKQEGFNLHHE